MVFLTVLMIIVVFFYCIALLGKPPAKPQIKDDRSPLLRNYDASIENYNQRKEKAPVISKKVLQINTDLSFVAIDFETANKKYNSACALGIAVVENGHITESRHWLIKPPSNRFEFTDVHGISWDSVKNKGTFKEQWHEIKPYLEDKILVAHNAMGFDMRVLEDLLQFYNISFEVFEVWDTLDIAKKTWHLPNYKLNTICQYLNIELNHHEAKSDAIAAAWVALYGINRDNKKELVRSSKEFKRRDKTNAITTVKKRTKSKVQAQYFDDTTLEGNTIVFTGELMSISRDSAIEAAKLAGAIVRQSVSRNTHFLVVGTQTATIGERSIKELKADELIEAGYNIKILSEDEFLEMV